MSVSMLANIGVLSLYEKILTLYFIGHWAARDFLHTLIKKDISRIEIAVSGIYSPFIFIYLSA